MTSEEIRAVLHAYADAKARHDVEAIVALRHEDCFDEAVPLGTRIEGRDAVGEYFRAFFAAVPDYRADFDGEAIGEDSAVVWGRWRGTIRGSFMGIDVDGSCPLEVPVAFVCTFRDGLVVGDSYYFDAATLAEQAGVQLERLRPVAVAAGESGAF
jgi:predicted ester cyclase